MPKASKTQQQILDEKRALLGLQKKPLARQQTRMRRHDIACRNLISKVKDIEDNGDEETYEEINQQIDGLYGTKTRKFEKEINENYARLEEQKNKKVGARESNRNVWLNYVGKEEPKTSEGTRPKMKRMKEAGFKKLAGSTVPAIATV